MKYLKMLFSLISTTSPFRRRKIYDQMLNQIKEDQCMINRQLLGIALECPCCNTWSYQHKNGSDSVGVVERTEKIMDGGDPLDYIDYRYQYECPQCSAVSEWSMRDAPYPVLKDVRAPDYTAKIGVIR